HGQRAAIVGDNGQGKTTLLRTLVHSLDPLAGQMKWGHGVEIGTYAQHVYTSLDERMSVIEHLEYHSLPGTTRQELLAMAGALLFRDDQIQKKVNVLSGGERARLCMAGLLLSDSNVLVLDEPGNHLDVESVEALAGALELYRGTVIFTSHDRHFMRRVATCVIEVRDGSVKNHFGDYDSYLAAIEKEVDDGEVARGKNAGKSPAPKGVKASKGGGGKARQDQRDQRRAAKELKNVEKKIARLDDEKRELNAQLLTETDPDAAVKLHDQVKALESELAEAEERWLELSAEQEWVAQEW
ncbi:MAG: ATP-binding cassette domain-containing protein, partial [Novipirellula sp. JB048]